MSRCFEPFFLFSENGAGPASQHASERLVAAPEASHCAPFGSASEPVQRITIRTPVSGTGSAGFWTSPLSIGDQPLSSSIARAKASRVLATSAASCAVDR